MPEQAIDQVKTNLHIAIQTAPDWGKAWHSWALFNAQMLEYYARTDVEKAQRHVAPAASGFFKSVALGQAVGGEPLHLMPKASVARPVLTASMSICGLIVATLCDGDRARRQQRRP